MIAAGALSLVLVAWGVWAGVVVAHQVHSVMTEDRT